MPASGDMDASFPIKGLLLGRKPSLKFSNSGVVFSRQFSLVQNRYSARIDWYMARFRSDMVPAGGIPFTSYANCQKISYLCSRERAGSAGGLSQKSDQLGGRLPCLRRPMMNSQRDRFLWERRYLSPPPLLENYSPHPPRQVTGRRHFAIASLSGSRARGTVNNAFISAKPQPPKEHPADLHALTDLRHARAHLQRSDGSELIA